MICDRRSRDLEREMCAAIGLKSFRTVDVWHRTRCYGAVIKHNDGWSIVSVYFSPFLRYASLIPCLYVTDSLETLSRVIISCTPDEELLS